MIDSDVLERVLGAAVRTGAEFAEVYAEDKRSTSAGLDDGRVEQVTSGRDRGAGIRVVKGDTTGFAHTADLSEAGLLAAAQAAATAASQGDGRTRTISLTKSPPRSVSAVEQFPEDVRKADKVAVLLRMDEAARSGEADSMASRLSTLSPSLMLDLMRFEQEGQQGGVIEIRHAASACASEHAVCHLAKRCFKPRGLPGLHRTFALMRHTQHMTSYRGGHLQGFGGCTSG